MVPLFLPFSCLSFSAKVCCCSAFSSELFYEKHILEGTLNIPIKDIGKRGCAPAVFIWYSALV